MGLIIDTGVFILIERRKAAIDWSQQFGSEQLCISTITVSELMVGVIRADNQSRRDHR
jgi:predicted nucleic acid-binding protein